MKTRPHMALIGLKWPHTASLGFTRPCRSFENLPLHRIRTKYNLRSSSISMSWAQCFSSTSPVFPHHWHYALWCHPILKYVTQISNTSCRQVDEFQSNAHGYDPVVSGAFVCLFEITKLKYTTGMTCWTIFLSKKFRSSFLRYTHFVVVGFLATFLSIGFELKITKWMLLNILNSILFDSLLHCLASDDMRNSIYHIIFQIRTVRVCLMFI